MGEYVDIFNVYIMGSAQMLVGFHYFAKLLQKRADFFSYLLFLVCGILEIRFVTGRRIADFSAYTLMLTVSGMCLPADLCGEHLTLDRRRNALFYGHTDWKSAILYAALTVEVMQLCFGIVNTFQGILFPIMHSLDQSTIGMIFMVLGYITALPMAAFCYRMICRYFAYYETVKKQYVLMILIPVLLIFLVGEYMNYTIYGSYGMTQGSAVSIRYYLMLVVQLLGMASLFCILFAYKKLLQNVQLTTELSLLEQEEHSLNQYVEEAKAHYDKTKSFRHDIRNHIAIVKELLQYGKMEQALRYVGDLEEMTEELSFPCSTNNPVADILLGNKLGIAQSMGIEVRCPLVLPYPCPVRDIDFCIILSNALDNAIHACRMLGSDVKKYICVAGRIQGDFLLLEVENSFEGSRAFKKGTGLSNIKAVAEKYHGTMSIKTQGNVFTLSVLLIIPQQTECILQQRGSFHSLQCRKPK
ncbi:MAG: GHKL domain-containing protein [Lachnospiraceae bacterium]|nr:GHKL domain-containing protein [Lachnospiraceae bacterium]